MIVQCENCRTQFNVDESRIKDGGSKVRCAKCKNVFIIYKPSPEPDQDLDPGLDGDLPGGAPFDQPEDQSSPDQPQSRASVLGCRRRLG